MCLSRARRQIQASLAVREGSHDAGAPADFLHDPLHRIVGSDLEPMPAGAAIETKFADGTLADYHLVHAARAEMLRRLGRADAARAAYRRALELAYQGPERRFLRKRLAELGLEGRFLSNWLFYHVATCAAHREKSVLSRIRSLRRISR